MLTQSERLEKQIERLMEKSCELKNQHEHGDWNNWRLFTSHDIRIKELTIQLLQLDIDDLNDSLDTYLDY